LRVTFAQPGVPLDDAQRGPYGRSYGRLPKAASCGWLSPVLPCSAFSQSLGVTLDTGSASCVSRRARVREYGHVVDRSALMRLLAVPDRRAEAIRAVAGGSLRLRRLAVAGERSALLLLVSGCAQTCLHNSPVRDNRTWCRMPLTGVKQVKATQGGLR